MVRAVSELNPDEEEIKLGDPRYKGKLSNSQIHVNRQPDMAIQDHPQSLISERQRSQPEPSGLVVMNDGEPFNAKANGGDIENRGQIDDSFDSGP